MPAARPTRSLRHSLLTLAICAAMLVLAAPASRAADQPCPDGDANTDQGAEDGATGENTTCHPQASAYGWWNIAGGDYSSAFGYGNTASAIYSSAFGYFNNAYDNGSVAMGAHSRAGNSDASLTTGANSVAVGTWIDTNGNGIFDAGEAINQAVGRFSSSFGVGNTASGVNGSAFGYQNTANGTTSSAFGSQNIASGTPGNAFGHGNLASGYYSSAFGISNTASGNGSSAFGQYSRASGDDSSAFGWYNAASGFWSAAFGSGNTASGRSSSAFGVFNTAYDNGSVAMGAYSSAGNSDASLTTGANSIAVGTWFDTDGSGQRNIGEPNNQATAQYSSSFGVANIASGFASSVLGYQSQAASANSTALGYQAVASVAGAVSFGHSATDLDVFGNAYGSDLNARLMHVAAGIDATDAVNLGQLNTAIGGINSYAGWNLSAAGGAAQLVGDGDAVDFQANDANGNLTVSRTGNTITYGFNSFTSAFGGTGGSFNILAGTTINMGGNVVSGVANGVANTDAVNLGQLNTAIGGISSYTGWNLSAAGGAAQLVGDGDAVDFQANDANGNLTVSRTGNTITYGFNSFTSAFGGTGGSFSILGGTTINMGGNVVSGVANGVANTDAVNVGQMNTAIAGIDSYAGWNLSAGGGAAQLIGDGDGVNFEASDPNGNLTVSRSGNTITYDFNSLTSQFGGAGGSFSILAGTTINMGGNVVSGVANGVANTDAVNLGQLNAAIGGISSYTGWNLSAGGGAAQLIGDGDAVDFQATDANGNLTVSRTGNTITYGFNSFTSQFGGAGGSFSILGGTTINMGGNVISGVANGLANTDAVNLGQLNSAIGGINSYAGWNLTAGGGAPQLIGDGDGVNFEANDPNGNLTVSRTGNTITYGFNSFTTQFGGAGGSFSILAGTTIDMGGNVISGVADGVAVTDAVNLGQLNSAIAGIPVWDLAPFAAAFGGGAAWGGGVFTAPSYTIQGVTYNNVGAALAAIDGWMTANPGGIQYDDPSHGSVTLDGANGTQIKNVADGTDAMDAVNLGQMQAGDAATLTAANAYTDTKSAQTLAAANAYTDQRFAAWNDTFSQYQQQVDARFAQTDTRISRIGAMGTAMTQMAVNAAMSNSPRGRFAIGVGAQGGQGAVSIGYGRRIGSTGSFSLGASFASGESSVGAGFGFDL